MTLYQMVNEALDNAVENGHAWLASAEPSVVADDLKNYDTNFEYAFLVDMIPCIKEWQRRNNHKHDACRHGNCRQCEPCGDCSEELRYSQLMAAVRLSGFV